MDFRTLIERDSAFSATPDFATWRMVQASRTRMGRVWHDILIDKWLMSHGIALQQHLAGYAMILLEGL